MEVIVGGGGRQNLSYTVLLSTYLTNTSMDTTHLRGKHRSWNMICANCFGWSEGVTADLICHFVRCCIWVNMPIFQNRLKTVYKNKILFSEINWVHEESYFKVTSRVCNRSPELKGLHLRTSNIHWRTMETLAGLT